MVTSHAVGSRQPTAGPKVQARVRIFLTNMSDFWDALASGDFPAGGREMGTISPAFMDVDWTGRTVVLRGAVDLVGEVLSFLSSAGVLVSSNQ